MILFSETRPATLDNMSWIRRAMRRSLGEIRLMPEAVDDIQLIVSEIGANIVRHSTDPAETLGVELVLSGSTLRLEITDDGAPFEDFETKLKEAGKRKTNDGDAFSGRGLYLVDEAADKIAYATGKPNRFTAWRNLANRRPTVLIVEDDETLSETYAAFLFKHFRVVQASGVESALDLAKGVSIDLIVSDFHLGDGDGSTIAETLEKDPSRLPAPVLMVTGDRDPTLHARMMAFGVEAMLQKPVGPTVLVEQVKLALQRSLRRRMSLFRHFGEAAARLHSSNIAPELRGMGICRRTKAADLCSGDAMIHCGGQNRDRILLMDLMGHGLDAHAAAIAFAAVARTVHGSNPDCKPGIFLGTIAGAINRDPALGQLLGTMIAIDILTDGRIELASAGHPPPVVLSNGEARCIEIGGPLLGFLPDAAYETAELKLQPSERLVILTDGVDPAPLSAGDPLRPWLEEAIIAGQGLSADAAIDLVVDRMGTHHGPEPEDDWTVMMFQPADPAI